MSARIPGVLLAAVIVVSGVVAFPLSASAANLTVTSSADSGAGSLREKLGVAGPGDVITFAPSVTSIAISSALYINTGVTIDGPGSDLLEITRAVAGNFDMLVYSPIAGVGPVVIHGLALEGRADGTGNGIQVFSNANTGAITLTDLDIHGQNDPSGAAVRIDSSTSTVTISDSNFSNNSSTTGPGGAIKIADVGGVTTISNSTFSSNVAQDDVGGALHYTGDSTEDVVITGSTFANNYAEGGGAVFANGVDVLYVPESEFIENVGSSVGGAIEALGVNYVNVDSTRFIGNIAEASDGGALLVNTLNKSLTVNNSYFASNTAALNGGAIATTTPTTSSQLANSTFDDNHAGGFGGAVHFQSSGAQTLYIEGDSFIGNSSVSGGGAIAIETVQNDFFISRSTFADNYAEGSSTPGQSLYVFTSTAHVGIASSTFDEPDDSFSAFAVHIGSMTGAGALLTMTNTTLTGAGGVHVGTRLAGSAYLSNSIVGSVSLSRSSLDLTSNNVGGTFYELTSSLSSSPAASYVALDSGSTANVADFGLEVLADNGGPTMTRMPLAGSPALGAASNSFRGEFDQRAAPFAGIVGGFSDIGAVTTQANWFADVTDPASPVYTYIQWMYESGSSTGTAQPSGKPLYNPSSSVSRQAMASFLYRLSGDTFTPPIDPTFADVPTSATFYTAIEWMAAQGISTGTAQPSGKPLYKPSDPVSRQAMALFIARYAGADLSTPPVTQSFADVPVSASSASAITWMKDNGISTGTAQPSGLPLYKPGDPVSRSAMAAFLYRLEHRP